MSLWRRIYFLATFQAIAGAIPTVTYPINAQVPPVARVSEPFSYSFSISTFSSDHPITYTLSSAPSWLSLDSSTRTLYGTPTRNDVGSDVVTAFGVELTASDQSGAVTLNSTFVISTGPAPVVSLPVSSQLPYFGLFSAPSTLIVQESSPFTYNFQPSTFSERGTNAVLYYYAITNANTPLPSWVKFDPKTLSLSGQTPGYPSLIGIQIIASDVQGFSGASISFEMAIGIHTLGFGNETMVIDAIPGAEVTFTGLASSIELDGKPTDISSIASITAQTPPWLTFNNSTLVISGRTPEDATSCNITVNAVDVYGDVATGTIFLDIGGTAVPASFTSSNPRVTTTPAFASAASREQFPKKMIAAIVAPSIALIFAILAALLWYRHRRRAAIEQYRRPYSREKLPFPANPNAQEIDGMAPPVPPKCLRLDALRYVDHTWRSPDVIDHNGERGEAKSKSSMDQSGEGSFNSTALVPEPLDLPGGGNRSRAGTENTLHRSKPSWGSTLTSMFPTVRSRTNSSSQQGSNYSPCSERGHAKRTARMWTPERDFRNMHSFGHRSPETMLHSRDSNISFGAMINFPILSEVVASQEKDESEPSVPNLSPAKSLRRRSRSLPSISRLYYSDRTGRPLSMLSLERGDSYERHSREGHNLADGQSWIRKPASLITVNTKDAKSYRSSSFDWPASTEPIDSMRISQSRTRQARDSLVSFASHKPEINLVERKLSRRSGSSPFFGAVSSRRPRQLSEQGTTTSADVVMYPEKPIDPPNVAMSRGLRESGILPPDSFESSLWSAREGTKQLKDYLQGLLRRTWTQESVHSDDPSYSLFESARGSLSSMHPPPSARDSRESEVKRRDEDQRRETFLPDAGSDWSWETHCTPQDDQGTVIEDWPHDSPATEIGTVAAGSSSLGSPASGVCSREARMRADSGMRLDANSIGERSTGSVSRAVDRGGCEGGELDGTTYI